MCICVYVFGYAFDISLIHSNGGLSVRKRKFHFFASVLLCSVNKRKKTFSFICVAVWLYFILYFSSYLLLPNIEIVYSQIAWLVKFQLISFLLVCKHSFVYLYVVDLFSFCLQIVTWNTATRSHGRIHILEEKQNEGKWIWKKCKRESYHMVTLNAVSDVFKKGNAYG